MAVDGLSGVFDLVEVRGVVSGGFAARGRWFARADVHLPLKFLAVPYGLFISPPTASTRR